MTGALVVTAVALLVLFLRERANDHRVDRILAASNSARLEERKEWTRERQTLLNRIKPETSQYVAPDVVQPQPEAVSMFDDEDFWESKDELAQRAMAEELGR